MKIDHIGYAVKSIDRALSVFQRLGFSFGTVIDDPDRNIKVVFGEKEGYRIELVCPLEKGKVSPVDVYLGNVGPTPYHICYQSEDLDAEVEYLKRQAFKMIIEPRPAVVFGGKRVAFMMNLGVGLLEIVET